MAISQFDPNSFLDAQITEVSEKRPPLEVGDYVAVIGEVKARAWQGKADPSKSGIAWDIPLTLELPPEAQELLKRPTLTITDSLMLDLTDSGGIDLAPGKNSRMRLYREALDMNKPGDKFSARMMTGQVVMVRIKHELYNEEIQERVQSVAKAS